MSRKRNLSKHPDPDVCVKCNGSGWKMVPTQGRGGWFEAVERCSCWLRKSKRNFILNLPVAMQDMTLEKFDWSRLQPSKAFEALRANPGAGFLFVGPYGAGKTHLLTALYIAVTIQSPNLRTMFCTSREVMEALTEAARGRDTELMDRAKGKESFHLFWDDIDKIKETESRHEMMFSMLDSMLMNRHRITATSNFELRDLPRTDVISADLTRRIDEMINHQIALRPEVSP